MMHIIVSYSKKHFDPNHLQSPHTSAGIIASEIYIFCAKINGLSTIQYIDPEDFNSIKKISKKVDLFIGIDVNFISISKYIRAKQSILVAVNMHPVSRRKIIKKCIKNHVPASALHNSDGIYALSKSANYADKILLIGNSLTLQSYLSIYSDSKLIITAKYLTPKINFNLSKKREDILIFVGDINFRKCSDIYFALILEMKVKLPFFKFILVGRPVNSYWKKMFESLIDSKDSNLNLVDWIDPFSESFSEILFNTRLALFFSREEGLSGSSLFISRSNIPIMTTKQVGLFPISELQFDIDADRVAEVEKFTNLLNMPIGKLDELAKRSNLYTDKLLYDENSISEALAMLINSKTAEKNFIHLTKYKVTTFIRSFPDALSIYYLKAILKGYFYYYRQKLFFVFLINKQR
jgi:hypothetical protein